MMLRKFFEYLNEEKIFFCLMNNGNEISEQTCKYNTENSRSDYDIYIEKKFFNSIEIIINEFCRMESYQIVQIYHHDYMSKNFYIFNPADCLILNLDLYADVSINCQSLFRENDIISTVTYYNDVPSLSPDKEFIHYLLKKHRKSELNVETYYKLKILFEKEPYKICDMLKRIIIDDFQEVISAFRLNDPDLILTLNELKLNFNVKDSRVLTFLKMKYNIKRIFFRVIKPTGLTISILGPDGSGKSTIIDGLKHTHLPFRRTEYFHLKPLRVDNKKAISSVNPHEKEPYSFFVSFVKILYLVFQYNFYWFLNIQPLKIKSSLVIFDRYYDDLLVDPRRFRLSHKNHFSKISKCVIPKTDVSFVLVSSADVIYNRKKEVSFDELKRQIYAYGNLCESKTYFLIEVDREPSEIIQEIYFIIMDKMNENK